MDNLKRFSLYFFFTVLLGCMAAPPSLDYYQIGSTTGQNQGQTQGNNNSNTGAGQTGSQNQGAIYDDNSGNEPSGNTPLYQQDTQSSNPRSTRPPRRRYAGEDSCRSELEDDRDHTCKEDCRTIYTNSDDREDCEKLSVEKIQDLYSVYNRLKDAAVPLNSTDLEDLKAYLKISTSAFVRAISRDYHTSEAKDMLVYIAEDDEVAEIIADYDENYRVLYHLLKKVKSSHKQDNDLADIFTTDMRGRSKHSNLFEIAILDGDNETAVNWFLDYILAKQPNCKSTDDTDAGHRACFDKICAIGNDFFDDDDVDNETMSAWFRHGSFSNYIEDVIIEHSIRGCASPSGACKWDNTGSDAVTSSNVEEKSDADSKSWVGLLCE